MSCVETRRILTVLGPAAGVSLSADPFLGINLSPQVPELEKATVHMKSPEHVRRVISALRKEGPDKLQVSLCVLSCAGRSPLLRDISALPWQWGGG